MRAITQLQKDLEDVPGLAKVRALIGDEFGDVEVRLSATEAAQEGEWIDIYEVESVAGANGFKKGSANAYNEPVEGEIDGRVSMTFFYTYPEVSE